MATSRRGCSFIVLFLHFRYQVNPERFPPGYTHPSVSGEERVPGTRTVRGGWENIPGQFRGVAVEDEQVGFTDGQVRVAAVGEFLVILHGCCPQVRRGGLEPPCGILGTLCQREESNLQCPGRPLYRRGGIHCLLWQELNNMCPGKTRVTTEGRTRTYGSTDHRAECRYTIATMTRRLPPPSKKTGDGIITDTQGVLVPGQGTDPCASPV